MDVDSQVIVIGAIEQGKAIEVRAGNNTKLRLNVNTLVDKFKRKQNITQVLINFIHSILKSPVK